MQVYLRVEAYSMMGQVAIAATVRTSTPEGSIEPVLALTTLVDDDGETEPVEFARGALVALLEVL